MNQKNTAKWITIILSALTMVCIIANLFMQSAGASIPKYYHVMVLFHVGTCLLAILYVTKGNADGSSKYYHWYAVSLLLLQLVAMIAVASGSNIHFHAILVESIALICASVLALGGELGRKKSLIYGVVLLIANTVFFIARAIVRAEFNHKIIFSIGAMCILSLIYLCMIYAKYMNKKKA